MKLAVVALAVLAAIAPAGDSPLAFRLKPGKTAKYRIAMVQTEVGADGKQISKVANDTPIKLTGLAPNRIKTEIGPLFAQGRSVGRAKVKEIPVAADGSSKGYAPVPLFVTLPSKGASIGHKWTGPFAGLAPIPAGLKASYRYVANTKDGKFAEVSMSVAQKGATAVDGSGKLFLRRSDGILDHGNAKIQIAYMRPDQKDRSKMLVNSRVTMALKVTP